MRFDTPHRTLVDGADLCPNGLLKTLPEAPKAKCGTPLPRRNPAMKYQTRNRSNPELGPSLTCPLPSDAFDDLHRFFHMPGRVHLRIEDMSYDPLGVDYVGHPSRK